MYPEVSQLQAHHVRWCLRGSNEACGYPPRHGSPNLIQTDQLPKDWPQRLESEKTPYRVKSATNTPNPVARSIRLLVQVGSLAVRVRFLVVRDMSIPCILGTAYMERHVEAIHCRGKLLELSDKSVVAISEFGSDVPDGRAPPAEAPSSKLKVAFGIRIPSCGEALVPVQTARAGLVFLQTMDNLYSRNGITMANGVAEAIPHSPFRVKVMNLSKVPWFLPKVIVLGYALPHPTQVVALVDCSSEESRAAAWGSAEAGSARVDDAPDPEQGRANQEA